MTSPPLRFAMLSGAGGGVLHAPAFAEDPSEVAHLKPVLYPGWRRYAAEGFGAEDLVRDLADEIAGWGGRVALLGVSLGGHLGYAVALRLQSLGVEVVGLCAVDSFVISSSAVRPGSAGRHFARLSALARKGGQLGAQGRALFWRALLRMAGDRVAPALRRWGDSSLFRRAFALDPALEGELSMRLLMRATAPWLSEIDRAPVPLQLRALHLRTATAAESDGLWRARCPGIEIVEIPGDHDDLLDPENYAEVRRAFAHATADWR